MIRLKGIAPPALWGTAMVAACIQVPHRDIDKLGVELSQVLLAQIAMLDDEGCVRIGNIVRACVKEAPPENGMSMSRRAAAIPLAHYVGGARHVMVLVLSHRV